MVERTSQAFTLMKLRLKEATESVKLGSWGKSPLCFVLSRMAGRLPGRPGGKPQGGHQAGEGPAQFLRCLGKGLLQGLGLRDTQLAAHAGLWSDTLTILGFSEGPRSF